MDRLSALVSTDLYRRSQSYQDIPHLPPHSHFEVELPRGVTPPSPTRSSLPHAGFGSTNDLWKSTQDTIVMVFQQKRLDPMKLPEVFDNVRSLVKSDIGAFIYDFYKDHLMRRGMVILRENIRRLEGEELLEQLSSLWDTFFKEIMPTLQAILHPIQTKGLSVRQVTLIGFRDIVLLKTGFADCLKNEEIEIPPALEQMILVLQTVHDAQPPSDNYLKVESMAGQVIYPFLGVRGLYEGGTEPVIYANQLIQQPIIRSKSSDDLEASRMKIQRPSSLQVLPSRLFSKHNRQSSVSNMPSLGPVPLEEENCECARLESRRHSFGCELDTAEA